MKLVYTQENRFDVSAMRTYLESHGIPSFLKNEYTSSIMGEVPFFSVWPEIWVADELFDQAKKLVQEAQSNQAKQAEGQVDKEWFCHACKESNPVTFELCWQCATPMN